MLSLAYKQGLLFEKPKEPGNFRASKTRKVVRKVSKNLSNNKF